MDVGQVILCLLLGAMLGACAMGAYESFRVPRVAEEDIDTLQAWLDRAKRRRDRKAAR